MSERPKLDSRFTPVRRPGDGSDAEVRLVPPPRAAQVHPVAPADTASHLDSPATGGGRRRTKWWAAAAAVALGGALLAVFTLLPGWVESHRSGRDPTPPPGRSEIQDAGPQTGAVANLDEPKTLRSDAEDIRAAATDLQSSLESRGVSNWSPAEYSSAVRGIATGDGHFRSAEYAAALAAYDEARRQLSVIESRASLVARQALDEGARALAAGESQHATAAFQLALQLEPDSRTAAVGLRRAQVLDEVMDLLGKARAAERQRDFGLAADLYRRAAALDPVSEDARSGLDRVARRMEHDEFASFMSAGLDALDREDYPAARAAFERASDLRPGSPEVADGLARVETGQRVQTIGQHRLRAATFEQEELWESAAAEYEHVLALDPAVAFARHGRDRAVARAQLGARIDFHLEHPDRLNSAHVLEEAVELLVHARTVSPQGSVLSGQIDRLEEAIRVASTPVRVELESDGLTDVVIHGVGRFGTFTRRSVDLRPGIYTVVGTRHGYRDVRVEWRVAPETESEPLVIRCEEEI
jgi:tetratricopeptide (TPR) repeat protein